MQNEQTPQKHEHETIRPPKFVDESDKRHQIESKRGNDGAESDGTSSMSEMVASLGSHWARNKVDEYLKSASGFDWDLVLDKSNCYKLSWSYDYSGNQIKFGLEVDLRASGFRPGFDLFALGFSNRGELASSDFCLLWFDLAHRLHIQDAITNARNELRLVARPHSACRLIKRAPGKSKEDKYQVTFTRPLTVCSNTSYYSIDNGTTHLVWFTLKGPLLVLDGLDLKSLEANWNSSNRTSESTGSRQFEWGLQRVQLIASKLDKSHGFGSKYRDFNSEHQHHSDIRMEKYQVAAKETTYWCKLFRLADKFERRRFHITKYEPLISEGLEHVVHHMELFNCANLDPNQRLELQKLYELGGGWSGDCNSPERPKALEPCRRVIMAWAMGAKPFEYPPQVGQSIGGLNYSPFVVLEVHYNNLERRDNLVDSSGLRYHYTNRLRPFNAGILEVGLEYTPKNSIPPRMVAPIAGHCVSECTRAAMSNQNSDDLSQSQAGIFVFAAQLHTHLTGVASWTEQVRGGEMIGELQRDDHYSPHFQEIRLFPEPRLIAPGDSLLHYCLYDTRERSNMTLGGFGTKDEMCVTYLHYYPRIELEVCKSSVDSKSLDSYFAYLAREESQPVKTLNLDPSKSIIENYRSIEWSDRRKLELLQLYANSPLSVQCQRSDGRKFAGVWEGIQPSRALRDQLRRAERPFDLQQVNGRDLISYRGREFGHRHAQCGSQSAGPQREEKLSS